MGRQVLKLSSQSKKIWESMSQNGPGLVPVGLDAVGLDPWK